jgi:hypothetical protein
MMVDAPWFMPNTVIRRDLQTLTVKEEIPVNTVQNRIISEVKSVEFVSDKI